MRDYSKHIRLNSPDDTELFARSIASTLGSGDVLLLEGQIGAGKTHFCRALIQSLLSFPEDIPSPTFTLVQIYDTDTSEVWHADLYRLSYVDEVEELGLFAAFDDSICLVEWPEKLDGLEPQHSLTLSFSLVPENENARDISLAWSDQKWNHKLNRGIS